MLTMANRGADSMHFEVVGEAAKGADLAVLLVEALVVDRGVVLAISTRWGHRSDSTPTTMEFSSPTMIPDRMRPFIERAAQQARFRSKEPHANRQTGRRLRTDSPRAVCAATARRSIVPREIRIHQVLQTLPPIPRPPKRRQKKNLIQRLVPGFGEQVDLPAVPGFGTQVALVTKPGAAASAIVAAIRGPRIPATLREAIRL